LIQKHLSKTDEDEGGREEEWSLGDEGRRREEGLAWLGCEVIQLVVPLIQKHLHKKDGEGGEEEETGRDKAVRRARGGREGKDERGMKDKSCFQLRNTTRLEEDERKKIHQ
jgi:hypothetical protein